MTLSFAIKRFGLLALALFLSNASTFGADPSRIVLPENMPALVAKLIPSGKLPATNQLTLALGLPLRNQAELRELLNQLYDPSSTNFHKFLTPDQFTFRFGPTESEYLAVRRFVESQGLRVAGTHSNRVVMDINGPAASVERAFGVNLRVYHHPTEKRDFFAPDMAPSIPANLPLADLWGLTDYGRPTPLAHPVNLAKISPLVYNGSGPSGSYQGRDFRNAYVPGAALTGAGQTAAVAEFDGYYASDIGTYESNCGYPNVPLTNILLNVTGAPGYSGVADAVAEVSLDIELQIAMAPGLSRLLVYEGNNPYTVFNRIAMDDTAKQISCSWFWGTGPTSRWQRSSNTTLDAILSEMVSQGQSFFQASGDSDAYTGSQSVNSTNGPIPVDSIYVTSVGGTSLSMNGSGTTWASETVWNWGSNQGSGGGISSNYSIPSWQTNVSMAANNGSTIYRNFPDVALTADAVSVVYSNGMAGIFGGTSCAAPLWAGFTALANQQAAAFSRAPVGFLNPALYALAAGPNYASCFHDITTGNNIGENTAGLYAAVSGYDLATGLGTPNGTNLINALAPAALPVFTSQPADQTVTNGGAAIFCASAGGQLPLSYRWLFNGTNLSAAGNISGCASNRLTLSAITSANAGSYRLVATNSYGAATSSVAMLNVLLPAAIGVPPAAQTIQCGSNASFTVTGSGTAPLAYEWFLDDTALVGATNTSLLLTNVHLPDHTVAVVMTNLCGSATSSVLLTVVDTLPPSISLNSTNPSYVQLGNPYVEPGANAYDLCAGAVPVAISGTVNVSAVGANTVTYTASDGSGNTNTATRTVMVVDTAPPTIVWSFTNLMLAANSNCTAAMPDVTGSNYIIALDAAAPLTITQTPTNNAALPLGTNVIVTMVTDVYGNTSGSTNYVVVADVTPPVITLNGLNALTIQLGASFIDSGVSASDTCSGLAQLTTNGTVNVGVVGTNLLTYVAVDGSGNTNTATRTVIVVDTTPPMIVWSFTNLTLAANSNCTAAMPDVTGSNYIIALDAAAPLTITQTPTNNAALPLGTNVIVTMVTDVYGNTSGSTNCVVVADVTPPVITLNDLNPLTIQLGASFIDPGVSASDTCSGLAQLTTNGTVNVGVVGTNLLTYIAVDGSGNANTATRTVIVVDTTPPTIVWSFTNLTLTANSNCVASMPDVTETNYLQATDWSGIAEILQSPTNGADLPLGTNLVVIAVADPYGNTTWLTNEIVVQDQTPPLILVTPQGQTNSVGGGASFNVGAGACTAMCYQWLFNGAAIAAQTNAALMLTNLVAGAGGDYSVIVTSAGGSITSAVAVLALSSPVLPPAPTALLLASSENPAGFKDSLIFTAGVGPTNATGTIQFLTNGAAFDMETLAGGAATSVHVAALPRGTNLVTAIYSGDASDLPATNTLAQVVTNHPPGVSPAFYTLVAGQSLTIPVTGLAASWTDLDGDALFIAAIRPSTNGVVVTNALPALYYANPNYVNDQFVCAISDGFGGTNYQTVYINVAPPTNAAPNIAGVSAQRAGLILQLQGTSGSTYVLEATTDFLAGAWAPIATNLLGTTGAWQFLDNQTTNYAQRFYRLELAP